MIHCVEAPLDWPSIPEDDSVRVHPPCEQLIVPKVDGDSPGGRGHKRLLGDVAFRDTVLNGDHVRVADEGFRVGVPPVERLLDPHRGAKAVALAVGVDHMSLAELRDHLLALSDAVRVCVCDSVLIDRPPVLLEAVCEPLHRTVRKLVATRASDHGPLVKGPEDVVLAVDS